MPSNTDKWYFLSGFALIIVFVAFLIWEPFFQLSYFSYDIDYHLTVARHYFQSGPSLWDNWESLPFGRPQLYPPLFHLLIAPLFALSLPPLAMVILIPLLVIFTSLLLAWYGVARLFNYRTSLFLLLLATSFGIFPLFSGVIMPATLVFALTPLLFSFIIKRKLWPSLVILTAMFYLQMVVPWFVVGSLTAWALLFREYRPIVIKTIAGGIIFFSPWLMHILKNIQFIKYLDSNSSVDILPLGYYLSLLPLLIIGIGLTASWVQKKAKIFHSDDKELVFFSLLLIVQLPILFTHYGDRFSTSGGFFALAIIAAVILDRLFAISDKVIAILIWICLILSQIIDLSLLVLPAAGSIRSFFVPSIWRQLPAIHQMVENGQIQDSSYTYTKEDLFVGKIINSGTAPGEPFLSLTPLATGKPNSPHLAAEHWGYLADRPYLNRRNPENYFYPPANPKEAKIIIANKTSSAIVPSNYITIAATTNYLIYYAQVSARHN